MILLIVSGVADAFGNEDLQARFNIRAESDEHIACRLFDCVVAFGYADFSFFICFFDDGSGFRFRRRHDLRGFRFRVVHNLRLFGFGFGDAFILDPVQKSL